MTESATNHLPVAHGRSDNYAPPVPARDVHMTGTILVVDDDESMCELLQLALERQGHKVVALTSASEALGRVAREDFDAVLTDLGMTEMSGLDLCERVIGTRPDMPVVVVTGHGSMESAIHAMRVGAYDFMNKTHKIITDEKIKRNDKKTK